MDLILLNPVAMVITLMLAATPVLLAAIGELVVEKSGVLNLGVEGMMIMGAVVGFVTAMETESVMLAFVAAVFAGMAMALVFAILTQFLLANQVATGLSLTLFGLGLSAMIGHSYTGMKPPSTPRLSIEGLSDLPIVGELVVGHDAVVYLAVVLVVVVAYFLRKTRGGLIVRAVGENHDAAHALGYKVVMVRTLCLMFGGACAGLGGAYLSLVRVPQWTEGMTAGAGWIALAIVVFASWKPLRVLFGAYLFGGIVILQLNLQAIGVEINVAFLSMAPYLMTIIVLVFMSSGRAVLAPQSLGRMFHASR